MEKTEKRSGNLGFIIALGLVGLAFAGLLLAPEAALAGAGRGLEVCRRVIIPNLLPFLVLSGMLTGLGVPRLAGKGLAPLTRRLFRLPGAVAAPFFLGLCGGYPMGAAALSALVRDGTLSREEGERALPFCNSTGPAFILGAAGLGAFHSTRAGLLLWVCHALGAVGVGLLFSLGGEENGDRRPEPLPAERPVPAAVLTGSVKGATAALLSICGFVVFFAVLTGLLDAFGLLSAAAGQLSQSFGMELSLVRALLTGVLELGSGISALDGLAPTPWNLAAASFLLGFGGLSVHCQTLVAAEEAGMGTLRHFFGKLLQGVLAALLTLLLGAYQ